MKQEGTSFAVWALAFLFTALSFVGTGLAIHAISSGSIPPHLAAKALKAVKTLAEEHALVDASHEDTVHGSTSHGEDSNHLSGAEKSDGHHEPGAKSKHGASSDHDKGNEHTNPGTTHDEKHGSQEHAPDTHEKASATAAKADEGHAEHAQPPEAHHALKEEQKQPSEPPAEHGHDDPEKGHGKAKHEEEATHGEHKESSNESHAGSAWSYEGTTGPAHWGKMNADYSTCNNGALQSPIDIKAAKQADIASPIQFTFDDGTVSIANKDLSLVGTTAAKNTIVVQGRTYDFVDFRFHSPSEHTIDGLRFPLEVALQYKDELNNVAVVSVLVAAGKSNQALQPLLANLPQKDATGPSQAKFNLSYLVPENTSYYRYDGSLTAPPCSEGVVWHLMKTPIRMSDDQIAVLSKRLGRNARPTQAVKDRVATINAVGFTH